MKQIFIVLLTFFSSTVSAQFSYCGREFRFDPYNVNGAAKLAICTGTAAQIIYTSIYASNLPPYYLNGIDTIMIPANTCDTFSIGGNFNFCESDSAMQLESDQPVSVYILVNGSSAPATLLFPVNNAGTDFYSSANPYLFLDPWGGISSNGSLFKVIALEDSSHIEIIPTDSIKCQNVYYPRNVPFDVWMNKGQVLGRSSYHAPSFPNITSLHGSYIHSLPFNGHKAKFQVLTGRSGGSGLFSTLLHSILPVSLWGNSYHAVPNLTKDSTLFKIISAYDSTVIRINGSVAFTLNTGSALDTLLNAPAVFSANHPFSCVQVSRDYTVDSVERSNGFMYQLMDDSQILTHSIFPSHVYGIITGEIDTELVCVITKTAFVGMVMLNGVSISNYFSPFPTDNTYSYAQVSVPNSTHILDCDSGCIAYKYGWGYHAGYGHIIGGVNELITGVKEVAGDNWQLSITPNPASNNISIKAPLFGKAVLSIVDLEGRVLLQKAFNNQAILNIEELHQGMYLIAIQNHKQRVVKKFVKQ